MDERIPPRGRRPEVPPSERAKDESEVPSRYRAHLLNEAKATEKGVVYSRGAESFLLEWTRVERALAAEVGEPEGVRTIVFDLAVETRGVECVAFRLDAEPGDPAKALARAIELGIGRERCSIAVREIAAEGAVTRWYPDLDVFTEANLETIRFR